MDASAPIYYKHNRLKQLRAFCHAARAGSISRAAEALYLSQPSVSLQIQALEREFEVLLFERRGPTIRLTAEGRMLLEMAQPLVHGMDALTESFAARRGDLCSGELTIAAGESTLLYLLPEPVKRFVRDYPGISLKLHNVDSRDGIAMLRADKADFSVSSMLEIPPDLTYRPIREYHPVLITAQNHPLARNKRVELSDISPYGLILSPRHMSTWRLVDRVFRKQGVDYSVKLEADGWEVIKQYVEQGIGVSIVNDICLREHEALASIPLDEYFPSRSYGVILRRGRVPSPPARRFIEVMAPDFFADADARAGLGP